jgi:hypothetical protein
MDWGEIVISKTAMEGILPLADPAPLMISTSMGWVDIETSRLLSLASRADKNSKRNMVHLPLLWSHR